MISKHHNHSIIHIAAFIYVTRNKKPIHLAHNISRMLLNDVRHLRNEKLLPSQEKLLCCAQNKFACLDLGVGH